MSLMERGNLLSRLAQMPRSVTVGFQEVAFIKVCTGEGDVRERGDWEKSWDQCSQHLGQVGGVNLILAPGGYPRQHCWGQGGAGLGNSLRCQLGELGLHGNHLFSERCSLGP